MKKILIIEDEADMRRNLQTILKFEQFEVASAPDGKSGLDLVRSFQPDLVLCDIMMPGMDGYQVLAALRTDAATATLPFIFLTAKGEKTDLRGGMNLGADDYLTKPVTKQELLAAVEARLKRHSEQSRPEFKPNFDSHLPLLALNLTPRVAEVLLWVAQGKTNPEIASILGISEWTVKKHVLEIFNTLGVETRGAAALRALEILSSPAAKPKA